MLQDSLPAPDHRWLVHLPVCRTLGNSNWKWYRWSKTQRASWHFFELPSRIVEDCRGLSWIVEDSSLMQSLGIEMVISVKLWSNWLWVTSHDAQSGFQIWRHIISHIKSRGAPHAALREACFSFLIPHTEFVKLMPFHLNGHMATLQKQGGSTTATTPATTTAAAAAAAAAATSGGFLPLLFNSNSM